MGLMSFLSGGVIEAVKGVVDELVTTDEERLEWQVKKAELELERERIEVGLIEKVHETNIMEARSGKVFIAGWRPFIGWVCGLAVAYHYVLSPFLYSVLRAFEIKFELPQLDIGVLMNLLLGMLGLAGLRTYEKMKGVQGKH